MNLLWRKESSNAALYVDLFKNKNKNDSKGLTTSEDESAAMLEAFNIHKKNDQMSTYLRQKGNELFQNEKWFEAMGTYNESLCYAENGSENMGLAYANRSACFLKLEMYRQCLVDIEFAKQSNYPPKLMPKLDTRREDCVKAMETFEPEHKLDYEENEHYPGLANVLEIRHDKKFGRCIVAKCEIPAGKGILVEKPFAARWLNTTYNSCAVCMNISMNFISCTQCTTALFCSSDCANANDMHTMDCAEIETYDCQPTLKYFKDSIIFFVTMFTNVNCLIEFTEDAIKTQGSIPNQLHNLKSKFRALLQLSSSPRPASTRMQYIFDVSYRTYNNLLALKSMNKMFVTEQEKRFLMHFVLHIISVMCNNGFDSMGTKMSMYIILSYFNHSCAPNVITTTTFENVRYCFTIRPIKAGQQLFISYVPESDFDASNDYRQSLLFDNFGFRCDCERCKPNMKFWLMNARDMRSDKAYQFCYTKLEEIMNNGIGTEKEKAVIFEKAILGVLNRFGDKHWCSELGGLISSYETSL